MINKNKMKQDVKINYSSDALDQQVIREMKIEALKKKQHIQKVKGSIMFAVYALIFVQCINIAIRDKSGLEVKKHIENVVITKVEANENIKEEKIGTIKTNWTQFEHIKDTSEKKYLFDIPSFLYDNLKIECINQKARNIEHCLRTWLSIAYAESTWNVKNNYFWLTSEDKSIKSWVTRYNKYWYKAKSWFFFYWDRWKLWASHYCTDEHSSWSKLGCPNGRKNFDHIFFQLKL